MRSRSARAIQKEALAQKPNKHSNSHKNQIVKQMNKKDTIKGISICAIPYPIVSRLYAVFIAHSDPEVEIL